MSAEAAGGDVLSGQPELRGQFVAGGQGGCGAEEHCAANEGWPGGCDVPEAESALREAVCVVSVKRYKQRLGVVEAIQYSGNNSAEVIAWCPYASVNGSNISLSIPGQSAVTIVANEWIIRTSKNVYVPGRAVDFGYLPFGEVYESFAGSGDFI